jgi:bifunctional UDP-N-acetylglucosamine pyrophosphorylase/glucosamine-1-phosphate N-acetyltransferase
VSRGGSSLGVLVLAAGQGTRMRSKKIKLLHAVAGRPMVAHVLEAVRALQPQRTLTVVGFQADDVERELGRAGGDYVLQREQRGTGHAVAQAAPRIGRGLRTLLILNGDLPTIRPQTLRALVARHRRSRASLSLVTTAVDDASGYGRVLRHGGTAGSIVRIVEHRDASPAEREIREINAGIYCAEPSVLFPLLARLKPNNAQGEYYLTDCVHELIRQGARVATLRHADTEEVLGVNTRAELARASAALYARKAQALLRDGVSLLDAARTWIDPRARIGRDSVIYPDVIVEGATVLGEDCIVRPGSRIVDCRIGRGVEIKDHSLLVEARIGDGASVGPFAHLRAGSVLGAEARVGNFVELKKAVLGRGTKASHLSYLGDARIGPDCNIGAGTITCNYDGKRKHVTTLGPGVFIGSDTQLVAPVTVHRGAYVAAGSTVTQDVPAGSLAIARSRQRNVRGWVARQSKKK